MADRTWYIRGYESGQPTFIEAIPEGSMSDDAAKELLRRLACAHLTHDEIIGASVGERTDLKLMPIGGGNHGWSTSGNPYYAAHLKDADKP